MTGEPDPYRVLGVPRGAAPDVISAAFRQLARHHHPDVSARGDAQERMAEINAAWSLLRNPVRRAAWDRANGVVGAPAHGSSTPSPGSHRASGAPGGHARKPERPAWRRGPDGEGGAGPPPGRPSGSVLPFGRHIGWSIGEIARVDPGYLQWLAARPEGARYRAEIDAMLVSIRR